MDTARKIEVIETTLTRRGKGTSEDPVRIITEYWSLDGVLLAEVDPFKRGDPSELCKMDDHAQRCLSHLQDIGIKKSVHRDMSEPLPKGGSVQCIHPNCATFLQWIGDQPPAGVNVDHWDCGNHNNGIKPPDEMSSYHAAMDHLTDEANKRDDEAF